MVTPEGIAFEGDVQELLVTGVGGGAGFMARHAPLVADLRMGHVKVQLPDGSWREWATTEGFASVHDSNGLVVVEEAIAFDAIDEALAREILSEAETEVARAEQQAGEEAEDVYRADVVKAERARAWGEHLLAIASGRTAGSH